MRIAHCLVILTSLMIGLAPVRAQSSLREVVELASLASTYEHRDQILSSGIRLVQSVDDSLMLVNAAYYSATKNTILRSTQHVAYHVQDAVRLATHATTYEIRDELLLDGRRLARTPDEHFVLQQAAYYSANKNEILRSAMNGAYTVVDVIRIATRATTYELRDEFLTAGQSRARGVEDHLQLTEAAYYSATKNTILRAGVRFANHVSEIIRLAVKATTYEIRDEILLQGIVLAGSLSDVKQLEQAAYYSATKKTIIDEYLRRQRFNTLHAE